jgi:asparagine synthase (glutamine-hydrolysing)
MCGIIAVFNDNNIDIETFSQIYKSYLFLSTRGPDSGNLIIKDKSIIGFRRLSINDLSEFGNQPIVSHDLQTSLICNGEIYNHKKLEEEYKISCASSSDCEVISHLYKKLGFFKTIKLLDGDFAIVISDGDMVHFARDRVGVRPLFTGKTKEGFLAIASLAKSLLSFCDNVKQLPPSMVSYNRKTKEFITNNYTYNLKSIETYSQYSDIKNILTDSVRKRLLSDRPIGCLLSGGIDSSIITSILCKLLGSSNVRTYSIGMEGSSDLKYARIVADYLKTNHTEVLFTPQEGIDAIPQVIESLETYDITTIRASVGMHILSKYIKNNTTDKVIFSGEGSDELLCGYLYFHNSPTPSSAVDESLRLIKDLYKYDVLRADRTVSGNGLELRVPFLDRDFLDFSISLSGNQKIPLFGYEKYILRKAFEDNYLPLEVLWRRKTAFSDGVSPTSKSWYEIIQEYVETQIDQDEWLENKDNFPSKEALWYKKIFNIYFPNFEKPVDYYWMPKWTSATDPSARDFWKNKSEI